MPASYFPPVAQHIGGARRTYLDEKESFKAMFSTLQWRHPGQYVAITDGQIATFGPSRRVVTQQYFSMRAHGPVYIGFVGPRKIVRQLSPFRTRPNAGLS